MSLSPHPDPPFDLNDRDPVLRRDPGPWMRSFKPGRAPLHFGRDAHSRFDAPHGEFGVGYVAEDLAGAFIETFGRHFDIRSLTVQSLTTRSIASISSSRPLRLIDLAGSGGLARVGADGRLTTGDYDLSQKWSLALWGHPVQADGIYYSLRHDPEKHGCAIFDRAADALTASPEGTWWQRDRSELAGILDRYGVGLILE